MSNLQYVEKISRVSNYYAPPVDAVTPFYINSGYELIEIVTGGVVFFEGGVYRKGSIFWHVYGDHTIHQTRASEPYRCMTFLFKMSRNTERTMPRVSHWNGLSEMDIFFSQALRFFHAGRKDDPALCQYLYARLFWEAVQENTLDKSLPEPVQRAISYIETNLGQELDLDSVARYARVSKSYLFVLFKEALNSSPHKYINTLRMNHARTLLAGSDKSIKEIAYECGYSSIASFYRIFDQQNNISPALYRERSNPYKRDK